MATSAALCVLVCSASRAEAQERVEEPHAWRVGLAAGLGGTPVDSEVTEQLSEALYDPAASVHLWLAAERWVSWGVGVGAGARFDRVQLSRSRGDRPESVLETFAFLVHVVVAARGSPSQWGGEAGVELGLGPAIVRWAHGGETASAEGLAVRLAGRLGEGLHGGLAWSVRPWIGTTWAVIGPAELSTAGLSAGIEVYAGWGWR